MKVINALKLSRMMPRHSARHKASVASALQARPLGVVMLSYWLTEEAGGPSIAAAGYASALVSRGVDVALIARDHKRGRWLVDEQHAVEHGFLFFKIPEASFASQVRRMLGAVRELGWEPRRTVLWVNAVWGPQSVAACLAGALLKVPYVVRPAGSLGTAALARKRVKKWLYYLAVESWVLRRASAIHCMSDKERNELPAELRSSAFVVPSGIDAAMPRDVARQANLLGVLARVHPIKNHHKVLDLLERLGRQGADLHLEFAGNESDPKYATALKRRINSSPALRGRVRFVGHVRYEDVPDVVGRWRAAVLLSEQENFGHAVITAAALGVPTISSAGVALGAEAQAWGAGVVLDRNGYNDEAVIRLLRQDPGETVRACTAFAARYAWSECGRRLHEELERCARVQHQR